VIEEERVLTLILTAKERAMRSRTVERAAEFARDVDILAVIQPEIRQRILTDSRDGCAEATKA
jgi:hypothetical protein